MSKDKERDLDQTLHTGERSTDPEVMELFEAAERVRMELTIEAPEARHERAMFVSGVVGRQRRLPWHMSLLPILATSAVVIALAFMSLQALPGDTLYPVRRALDSVGLGRLPVQSIDERIENATELLTSAQADLDDGELDDASAQATRAIQVLGSARDLLGNIDPDRQGNRLARIEALTVTARNIIVGADDAEDRAEDRSGPNRGPDEDDDNSGPGSDDDSEEDRDDNSSPGSDDDSDDDSGRGSDSDDSSGSGDGGDDSNSGSGKDDDSGSNGGSDDHSGSGDDDSGDGGSGSGSGSDDRSGSGSDDG